jgi:hypothetical protein
MRLDRLRASRFVVGIPWSAVLLVVLSAAVAALIAHIGIDVLGDYLLPHDTYDDVAHGSRSVVSAGALAVLVAAALRSMFALLDRSRAAVRLECARARSQPQVIARYASVVVGLAFALVAGMEILDLTLAGQSIDGIEDVMGGSLVLGFGVTFATALGVAVAAWRFAAWIAGAHRQAIRVLCAIVAQRTRHATAAGIRPRATRLHFVRVPAIARSTRKRGPPLALR